MRLVDHEGFLEGGVVLIVAAILAAAFAGWALKRSRRFAGFSALLIVGQAASLQLILCGNKIGYQHYPTPSGWASAPKLPLAIVLFEALIVVAHLKRFSLMKPKGWPIVLGVFFITSATLSADPFHYGLELVIATVIQLIHLGTLVLAVGSAPRFDFDRLLAHPKLPIAAAAFITVTATLLAIFSYQRHPHIPDEVVYLYHARYFAQGMLTMPAPVAVEAFNVDLMMYQGDVWYCPVPLGWPAMLAVGSFLGVEFLINPILAGGCVLLVHAIVRGTHSARTASVATLLMATSPWLVFLAMSYMTHLFTLVSLLAAGWALLQLHRTQKIRYTAMCGVFIGVVSLIRPLEGLGAAISLGVWALFLGTTRQKVRNGIVMGASSAVTALLQMPYNQALTGNPFKFPIMAYTDKYYGDGSNALGFGANRGLGWYGLDPFPGHGLIDIFVNGNLNLFQINCELHGWAIGSFVFIAIAVVSRRMTRADWGYFFGAGVIVFLHSFYWFSGGPDFGARYWFLTFVPGIVLTVRGIEIVDIDRTKLLTGVALLVFVCVGVYFPWRAIDKYHHYRLMRPDLRELAEEHDFGRAIVFIRGRRHPGYASAVTYNPIDFSEDAPIYATDRGDLSIRKRALDAYPDRRDRVFVVDGPTRTGRGFEVAAGPLTADEAMRLPP